MRGGKWISSLVLAAFVVSLATFLAIAADKGPDVIELKSPAVWPNPTKKYAPFNHKKHNEDYKVACAECHHVYKDGKNVWKEGDPVQKCEKCHTEPTIQGEKKLPPDQQKLNLKLAFHNNCEACHKKVKKEKPDLKIPVTCAQCHPGSKAD
jgi:cytochrome c553